MKFTPRFIQRLWQANDSRRSRPLGEGFWKIIRRKSGNMAVVHKVQQEEDWSDLISEAGGCLKSNQVVAVPTDTIYGVAALAQNTVAVNALYDIKGRDTGKPIAICVGDVADVPKYGKVTVSKSLLRELLPGPVTVVFERTLNLNPELNPGTLLVGIRVPDYGFVRDLARYCGEPLALTSANRSSEPSTVVVEEFCHLWPKLACVIDGGRLGQTEAARAGSTVVDLSKTGVFVIIRPGSASARTRDVLTRNGLTEEVKKS